MGKILSASGVSLTPRVTGIVPCGSQILVEVLTAQDKMCTNLVVGSEVEVGAPQGWVRSIGPSVKLEGWGFKIGDRVMLNGTGPICPKFNESGRDWVLLEPHSIKAVLTESND